MQVKFLAANKQTNKQTDKQTNKQTKTKQTNKQTVICSSTCLNGGTCQSASCQCRGGYAGNFCQVNCFHFLETFARSVAFTFWGLLPGQLLLLFGDFFQVNCFLFLESFARSIAFTFWRLLPGQLLSLFGDFCQVNCFHFLETFARSIAFFFGDFCQHSAEMQYDLQIMLHLVVHRVLKSIQWEG